MPAHEANGRKLILRIQDWQEAPEMLDSYRQHSLSPRHQHNQAADAALSPSSRRHHSSSGTDMESDSPSRQSPQVRADQPAGVDSDDNFEVSDDADERQVLSLVLCAEFKPGRSVSYT